MQVFSDGKGNFVSGGCGELIGHFFPGGSLLGITAGIIIGFGNKSLGAGLVSAVLTFILYYVIKHLIISSSNAEKQAEQQRKYDDEMKRVADEISSYNDKVWGLYADTGKILETVGTPLAILYEEVIEGVAKKVTAGPFIIPSNTNKILAINLGDYSWVTRGGIHMSLMINGQEVYSVKNTDCPRWAAFDVKSGDIVSIDVSLTDGRFNGDVGIILIKDPE